VDDWQLCEWSPGVTKCGGQTCLHCSFDFEVPLGNGKLFFENFASCMRISDWLADNRKFTVNTITAN
jgi:hypothetical protein